MYGDTYSLPAEFGEYVLQINNKDIHAFRKLNILGFCRSTMEQLEKKYTFQKVISGKRFGTKNGTIFLVDYLDPKSQKISKKVIKFLDPIGSSQLTIYNGNARNNFTQCFRLFSKEVISSYLLRNSTGFQKTFESGYAYKEITKYTSDLTIKDPQISGLYIVSDYIRGKLISKYSITEREKLTGYLVGLLRAMNEVGVTHLDLTTKKLLFNRYHYPKPQ